MSFSTHKSWLSPVIAITFIATSVTGILMFLHIHLPHMHTLHQWGGILFVVLGLAHFLLNWSPFSKYFKQPQAIAGTIAALCILILIVFLAPSPQHKRNSDNSKNGNWDTQHQQRYNLGGKIK